MDGQRVMMKDGGILTITNTLVEQLFAKTRYVPRKDRKLALESIVGSDVSESGYEQIEKLIDTFSKGVNIPDGGYIVKKDSALGQEIRKSGSKRVKIYRKGDSICVLLGYSHKMKRYSLRKDLDLELIQEGDLSEPFLEVSIDFMADWSGQLAQELKRVGADGLYSNELLVEADKMKLDLMNSGELGELLDDYTRKMKIIKDKLVD